MATEVVGDGKSWGRKLIEPASYWAMDRVHDVIPSLTPNGVTRLSAWLFLLGTFIQQEAQVRGIKLSPGMTGLVVTLKGLGLYGDKADGSMADVFDDREPGTHDRSFGQRLDAKWDRKQEAGAALLRARTAYHRGDLLGELAAYSAAITCPMPSIEKARVETLGFKPPEMGENILQALGARLGRVAFGELGGLNLPSVKGIYIQGSFDLASTLANLNTAYARWETFDKYRDLRRRIVDPNSKESQTMEFAKERLADMQHIQKDILKASSLTFIALRT